MSPVDPSVRLDVAGDAREWVERMLALLTDDASSTRLRSPLGRATRPSPQSTDAARRTDSRHRALDQVDPREGVDEEEPLVDEPPEKKSDEDDGPGDEANEPITLIFHIVNSVQ